MRVTAFTIALSFTALSLTAGLSLTTPAMAREPTYPYLDNETIGLYRTMALAVDVPTADFDDVYWGKSLLDAVSASGAAMAPLRYLIAFAAYSVGQTATLTPAYREPYRQTLERYIDKMLEPAAWYDWIEMWGPDPLGPDNIMYTGHVVAMMTQYRARFGDAKYESGVVLTAPDGSTFTTDLHALTASIAARAETYVDSAGAHTLGVACEPGRIYVPCNTPHRMNQVLYDRLFGTNFSVTNAGWVAWLEATMVDHKRGVLHDLYWPFGRGEEVEVGKLPAIDASAGGLYNGWSIWLLQALDPAWAAALFVGYKTTFLATGADSPLGGGLTAIADLPGAGQSGGIVNLALSLGATGFGLVTARVFGDDALYSELMTSWNTFFGAGEWNADKTAYSHWNAPMPLLIPTLFELLARTTSPTNNALTNVMDPVLDARFTQPTLTSVTNTKVFVNQAYWDVDASRLILTINGGHATTGPTDLVVDHLDPAITWTVVRNSAPWTQWHRDGASLVITTGPLSATEETYQVEPAPPTVPEPDSSAEKPDDVTTDAGVITPDVGAPEASELDASGDVSADAASADASPSESQPQDAGGCDANGGSAPRTSAGWLVGLLLAAGLLRSRLSRA